MENIDYLINGIEQEVRKWRRHFHRFPELSFQEEKTAKFIFDRLQSFGYVSVSKPTKTSVVASLKGRLPGKIIALRADIDALPITEENQVEYRSQKEGIMHACGHDGHAAMLLGAAKVLIQLQEQIHGEIRFIFQHAEEQQPGGAREIVASGALDGINAIIGLHLTNDLPVGKIGLTEGTVLANTDTFDLLIKGRGGHGSRPETTVDPVIIASEVVVNLQQIISRNTSALEAAVISVTIFQGGTSYSIIPQTVRLGGTVRSFGVTVRENIPLLIERIVKGITQAHGASFEFDYHQGYSAVINDPGLVGTLRKIGRNVVNAENVVVFPKRMASEDFSAYLQKAPGCFVFIGASNSEKGLIYSNHNSQFDIDEESLLYGMKVFIQSALTLTNDNSV
ncbi:amidohydrolase [Propionispira raffinosivorans]|uniref:amidohydrolase n=1 Tax=Propionispira raffinosivorans TaxID=86959 RepID=UPI00036AA1CD|nr:amidohydrolase [Propionispira raffinosivorans]